MSKEKNINVDIDWSEGSLLEDKLFSSIDYFVQKDSIVKSIYVKQSHVSVMPLILEHIFPSSHPQFSTPLPHLFPVFVDMSRSKI